VINPLITLCENVLKGIYETTIYSNASKFSGNQFFFAKQSVATTSAMLPKISRL